MQARMNIRRPTVRYVPKSHVLAIKVFFKKVLLDLWGKFDTTKTVKSISLTIYLIEMPFDAFKQNRTRPGNSCQSCLIRVYSCCSWNCDKYLILHKWTLQVISFF